MVLIYQQISNHLKLSGANNLILICNLNHINYLVDVCNRIHINHHPNSLLLAIHFIQVSNQLSYKNCFHPYIYKLFYNHKYHALQNS